MKCRRSRGAVILFELGLLLAVPRAARACGGGVVNIGAATVGADRQRIFLSVHAATTDVITEVSVAATTSDYGVLLPVAGLPTLDPKPVPAAELDGLDQVTAPHVYVSSSGGDDAGCSCLGAAGSNKAGVPGRGIEVGPPMAIGPVTAVVLSAENGDALSAWLAASGFSLPPNGPALVASYAGPGRSFIALRRNDASAPGNATSVGVHFTLPGDARALPLRFAGMGAAAQVSFTVLVAAPSPVGPAAPFGALTLSDLDAPTLRTSGYASALRAAVAAHANQAFLIEGVLGPGELSAGAYPSVAALIDPTASLTRLSTSLPSAALASDVALDAPFAGEAPSTRFVEARFGRAPGPGPLAPGVGMAFVVGLVLVRRRQGRRR